MVDTFIYKTRCDNFLKQSAASHYSGPCSTLVSSRSNWWWTKWQGTSFSPSISVLSCQYSICAPCSFIHANTKTIWSQELTAYFNNTNDNSLLSGWNLLFRYLHICNNRLHKVLVDGWEMLHKMSLCAEGRATCLKR